MTNLLTFEELIKEGLFSEWAEYLTRDSNICQIWKNAPCVIWARAKDCAYAVANSQRPDLAFNMKRQEIIHTYNLDLSYSFYKRTYDYIIACTFSMIVYSFAQKEERCPLDLATCDYLFEEDIQNILNRILHIIKTDSIPFNYDYTVNIIVSASNNEKAIKQKQSSEKDYDEILNNYRNHGTYGQCYDGIISAINNIIIAEGIPYKPQDCAFIFEEAEKYVNDVLINKIPELEITNVLAKIKNSYGSSTLHNGQISNKHLSSDHLIGCLIEMVFIIALWDSMNDKSDQVLQAFKFARAYFENHSIAYIYTENPMWSLLAKRIPRFDRPNIADYQELIKQKNLEINKLNEQIGKEKESKYNLDVCWIILSEAFVLLGQRNDCSKEKVASLLSKITGYSKRSFQNNYSSFKGLGSDNNKEQIQEAIDLMSALGLEKLANKLATKYSI